MYTKNTMIHDYPVLLDKEHENCDKSTHYYNHKTKKCQRCDSGRIKMTAQGMGGHDSSACEATIPQDEDSHARFGVVEDMSVAHTFIPCDSNLTCDAPFVCDREKLTCVSPEDNFKQNTLLPILYSLRVGY